MRIERTKFEHCSKEKTIRNCAIVPRNVYIPSLSLSLTIATFFQRGKEEESLCRKRLRRIVDKIPYIVLFELIAAE